MLGDSSMKPALCLCFYGQGQMDSHLVTVEVCVESGTYQRMKLDCLTFYQDRLKGLDTQTMQRRCTVQHNRMLLNNIFQHIPYFRSEDAPPSSWHS